LSPNYAGTLKGATGTIANICGFLTPALAGYLTGHFSLSGTKPSYVKWNYPFFCSLLQTALL